LGGSWKDAGSGDWELYNLKNDIGETNNLAEKFPEKLKELSTHMRSFIEDKNPL
jgi:arylsulfatase